MYSISCGKRKCESTKCLKEVNRLRQDLPLYDIPLKSASTVKRKLTGITDDDLPNPKKSKLDAATSTIKVKRKSPSTQATKAKRKCSRSNPTQTQVHENPLKFNPVNKQWQQNACSQIGLQFYAKNRVRVGGPNAPLTRPDMRSVKHIEGDGNCLFRAFSYIITGSESQHMAVRLAILSHMINIAHFILDHHILGYNSIQEYITSKRMDQDSAWGTDIEMLTLAHLLNTPILSYSVEHGSWQSYSPHHVDRSLVDDFQQLSLYIVHDYNHFNVVCSIRKTT